MLFFLCFKATDDFTHFKTHQSGRSTNLSSCSTCGKPTANNETWHVSGGPRKAQPMGPSDVEMKDV